MRELRNYGDEVAREITSRGGVEGSLSQERFFEDLMKLVRITVLQLCTVLAYCCGFSTCLPYLHDFYENITSPLPSWETCTEMILTISVWSSGGPGPTHRGLSTFHTPVFPFQSIFIANSTICIVCLSYLFSSAHSAFCMFTHFHNSIHPCFHTVMSPFPRTNQRGISLHKFLGLCTDLLPAPVFTSLLYLLRVSPAINRLIRATSSY